MQVLEEWRIFLNSCSVVSIDCGIIEGFQVIMEDIIKIRVHKYVVWQTWKYTYPDSLLRKDCCLFTGNVLSTAHGLQLSALSASASATENNLPNKYLDFPSFWRTPAAKNGDINLRICVTHFFLLVLLNSHIQQRLGGPLRQLGTWNYRVGEAEKQQEIQARNRFK